MPYIITLAILIATFPTTTIYNVEGYKLSQYQENGGCAIDDCPEVVKENFVPLSQLDHGTKEYWRTYCNEMVNSKFECR